MGRSYRLQDFSKMPFGYYKDQTMADVPADYLLWCHDKFSTNNVVFQYAEENLDVLKHEYEITVNARKLKED